MATRQGMRDQLEAIKAASVFNKPHEIEKFGEMLLDRLEALESLLEPVSAGKSKPASKTAKGI